MKSGGYSDIQKFLKQVSLSVVFIFFFSDDCHEWAA